MFELLSLSDRGTHFTFATLQLWQARLRLGVPAAGDGVWVQLSIRRLSNNSRTVLLNSMPEGLGPVGCVCCVDWIS